MATRHKGIIAYGTEEDRAKLAALSVIHDKSASEVVITMIRSAYKELLGDSEPERIVLLRNTG